MEISTAFFKAIALSLLGVSAIVAPAKPAQAACGEVGEALCIPLTPRFFKLKGFCEAGLIPIPLFVCRPPLKSASARPNPREVARLVKAIAEALYGPKVTPEFTLDLITAIRTQDIPELQRLIEEQTAFDEMFDLMAELGLRTTAMGISGGGAYVFGGGGEAGIALDSERLRPPYGYSAGWRSIGVQLSVGGDLVVTGLVPEPGCIAGTAFGTGAYADAGPGGGTIVWTAPDGSFAGISVMVGIGGFGGGVAEFVAKTSLPRGAKCPFFTASNPKPAPVPIPEPAPQPILAEVVAGDTLWAISTDFLGDGRRYPEIFAENEPLLRDPDLIFPGQVLTIPPS